MVITIDGPSSSGKSTVAQKIAQDLGIFYLNTGLLYRAITYLVYEDPTSPLFNLYDADLHLITRDQLDALPTISYAYTPAGAIVLVHGQDIVAKCYAIAGLDQLASKLSALPVVREFLLDVQRDIAKQYDVIADGRDCGTVIFPDAEHKFFLTASLDVRAQRRMLDPKVQALALTFDLVRNDLAERDERDENRAIAPLRIPAGATVIDSSDFSIDQIVEMISMICQSVIKKDN
jgi:cytidylate kinase